MSVGAAAAVELHDDALRERARGRVHRLFGRGHTADDVTLGDGPADTKAREERLRERADRHDVRLRRERTEGRAILPAVAQQAVRIVVDDDRAAARGEGAELLAPSLGERLARRVLEVRHDEEEARANALAPQRPRRGLHVEAL